MLKAPSPDEIAFSIVLVLALPATGWFGWEFAWDALADDRPVVSREVEAPLPVKGRWLRLLMLAPAHAFLLTVVFSGALTVLGILAVVILALFRGIARSLGMA
ncbi:MAG: hypothetical protein K0Q72_657 [Armatimonadetes bacterium]|nr:hypothetical protein [Armatimonadota bacterium]